MVYNLLLEYDSGGTLAGLIKKSEGNGLAECDVRLYTRAKSYSCLRLCSL